MYIDRASTWPQAPGIAYRRRNERLQVAHAFRYNPPPPPTGWTSLCGMPIEAAGAPPVNPGTIICIPCLEAVKALINTQP